MAGTTTITHTRTRIPIHIATDGDGSHAHGPFRHRHTLPDRGTGWRGLASLGLAGGMVPSASALILLLGAVSVGRPELGIVLTLAFGVGMAFVLAGVGVAVVVGRGAVVRIGGSRIPARARGRRPDARRCPRHRDRRGDDHTGPHLPGADRDGLGSRTLPDIADGPALAGLIEPRPLKRASAAM